MTHVDSIVSTIPFPKNTTAPFQDQDRSDWREWISSSECNVLKECFTFCNAGFSCFNKEVAFCVLQLTW